MHLTEARLYIKFLAGASLLMSFHLRGHCRPGYDVTHSSFLAGCTRRLPSIIAYHTHHPAAWTIISKYISQLFWFCTCIRGRQFNNKIYTVVQKNAPTLADYNYHPVQSILIIFSKLFDNDHESCLVVKFSTSPHIHSKKTLFDSKKFSFAANKKLI